MGLARVHERVNGPQSLVIVAGSGVFEPVHILECEAAGDDVEIAIPVHVVEMFRAILHVVGFEGQDLAQRPLLEIRGLVPEFARGNVGPAIAVDVPHREAFIIILVEPLHSPLKSGARVGLGHDYRESRGNDPDDGKNEKGVLHC